MKHTLTKPSATTAKLEVSLDAADLAPQKQKALQKLAKRVKIPGFRAGKTPIEVAEKHLDANALQQETIESAVNDFYLQALIEAKVQPLDRPEISLKKFTAYDTLEFTADIQIVPEIKLADYKKLKKEAPKVSVKAAEITEVLERLRVQLAEKKPVERAAKDGDEVVIDFAGKDAKGEAVNGATGKDYPLKLGSKSFIDGFEENLVGLKTGEQKEFALTFPKDYGHAPLANKKVTFAVTVKSVNEIVLPELDDKFAKQVGPFETLEALKKDIKEELARQQTQQARDKIKNEVVEELIAKSDVPLPQILVDDQARMVRQDALQNLAYRGQTLKDYLDAEKMTEEEWVKKEVTPAAEKRVSTGLVLAEVAKQEQIGASTEEVAQRIAATKQQIQDPKTRAQLDTPEAQRDISSRVVTEKTLDRLVELATKS